MTVAELAAEAGVHERYLREWLSHQAASNYVTYDPATRKFALSPEQAMVFAIEDSPVNLIGAFETMAALLGNQEKVKPAFKTGTGVGWGDQAGCMFCAVARFFRPGYQNNLVGSWLPALDGVVEKLERGARVADVGCGHGWSTLLMASAFPNSEFVGYDFHRDSIAEAQRHAREHDGNANVRFEVGAAKDYAGSDFDLVTFFDCLHDMGDPAGAASACVRRAEAGRHLDDGRAEGGGPARRQSEPGRAAILRGLDDDLRADLAGPGGRHRARRPGRRSEAARDHRSGRVPLVRRATETPFNMVLEARP